MIVLPPSRWTGLAPPLRNAGSLAQFLRYAGRLARVTAVAGASESQVRELLEEFSLSTSKSRSRERQILLSSCLLLGDLRMQGWGLRVRDRKVFVRPAPELITDRSAEKGRVRRQELLRRDAQLAKPSVQEFVRSMERQRILNGKHVSIFSLMRDGRELASALRLARTHSNNGWADALKGIVDPYIQVIHSAEEICPQTGLNLLAIWRYFRHTWTNQHTTVPGRNMMFLVRDAAAEFDPIVGIGSLSSPIMQMRERDTWIGWHPETFLEQIKIKPTSVFARWLVRVIDCAVQEIYIKDFLEEGILSKRHLTAPDDGVIKRLVNVGKTERKFHHRFVSAQEHKDERADRTSRHYWRTRARMHLFRSKRALALATYLAARVILRRYFGSRPTGAGLKSLVATGEGQDVIRKVLRKAKADRIGIAVADISVCGAVQPYNAILGGKLTAMLAASPEIVAEYEKRYAAAESEIASSMAGRPIVRRPRLVLLGTTSLYGIGSSQYNRIKVPCEVLGGSAHETLRYQELGYSEAFGTSQYSDETVEALSRLVAQGSNGQRVNSIFGEGVSPKFRKVRAGLDALNLPAELLLRHHRRRIIYGVSLVRNLLPFLIGLQANPSYLFSRVQTQESTGRLADWWRARWLRQRILSDAVLEEVAKHTLVRPVCHGARVKRADPAVEADHTPGLVAVDMMTGR
jgi:Druantia protein DruA